MHALPPVDSLRCFVAAAQTLNFRAAAREVHLSPAALGQRIRQLEDFVGMPLFERTTRKVQLTAAGQRLYPEAHTTVQRMASWGVLAADEGLTVERSIVLGTRHELGLSWLTPQIPKLEASLPGLTLHLYFGSGPDVLSKVESGEIDAAVTSARIFHRRLAHEELHTERYCMVASKKLAKGASLRKKAVLARQCAIDTDDSLPLLRYWQDSPEGDPLMRFASLRFVGTIGAVKAMVQMGAGVAVLPEYFVRKDIDRGRLVQLFGSKALLHDSFRLVYREDHVDARTLQKLAASLRKAPLR